MRKWRQNTDAGSPNTPTRAKGTVADIYIYIYIYIENAHATPPHLDVILHLGSSGGMHGSLQFFAFGLRSLFSSVECFPTHLPIHSWWPLFAYWYMFSGQFWRF